MGNFFQYVKELYKDKIKKQYFQNSPNFQANCSIFPYFARLFFPPVLDKMTKCAYPAYPLFNSFVQPESYSI